MREANQGNKRVHSSRPSVVQQGSAEDHVIQLDGETVDFSRRTKEKLAWDIFNKLEPPKPVSNQEKGGTPEASIKPEDSAIDSTVDREVTLTLSLSIVRAFNEMSGGKGDSLEDSICDVANRIASFNDSDTIVAVSQPSVRLDSTKDIESSCLDLCFFSMS